MSHYASSAEQSETGIQWPPPQHHLDDHELLAYADDNDPISRQVMPSIEEAPDRLLTLQNSFDADEESRLRDRRMRFFHDSTETCSQSHDSTNQTTHHTQTLVQSSESLGAQLDKLKRQSNSQSSSLQQETLDQRELLHQHSQQNPGCLIFQSHQNHDRKDCPGNLQDNEPPPESEDKPADVSMQSSTMRLWHSPVVLCTFSHSPKV